MVKVNFCFFTKVGRVMHRKLRPWILQRLPDTQWTRKSDDSPPEGSSEIYDILTRVVTYFMVNYTALAFVILTLYDSFVAWS